jgi:N-acetylmuramic acid 6-phosphate etherase
VMGALRAARARRALTVGFANNPDTPLVLEAEIGITLDTGNEVISGSTRLKAGTSQKIALNTFSSALMVKLNKVYGNLMVDLKPTNAKLLKRAINLTMLASGADEAAARTALGQCDFHVKVAVVALSKKTSIERARSLLDDAQGSVRKALAA